MRILKFLAAAFVAALAAGSLPAQRADTDLQAKAREALQQAEAEQDATNNVKGAVKAAPPAAPAESAPAAPVVVATPPRAVSQDTPAPAPTNAEAEREEHLRQLEAARAKQAETAPPPAVEIAPAPAPAPAGKLSPDAEMKAREAMRQAMEELDAQQKTATAAAGTQRNYTPPPPVTKPAPEVIATTPPPGKSGFEPSVTSAATSPVPSAAMTAKQQRLAVLLNQYKMDQITPQQYFDQKAKILAEPEP